MSQMKLTIYEFTPEDLASNQRGFITPSQTEFIKGMADGIRRSQRGGLPLVIFFLLLGLGIFFGMTFSNESARKAFLSDPVNLLVMCSIPPIVLGIFGISIYLANRRAAQLEESGLKVAEGEISWDEEYSKTGPTYFLYVGESEFTFGEDLSGDFPAGRRGRIFHCETSFLKLILSHELLD